MKIKFIYLIGLSFLTLATGCEKKRDRIFDENPTERLNASVASAHAALQSSSNGWLIKYYPSSALEFGGYTIFANFTSPSDVELTLDYSPTPETSLYTIYPGAGPILTFDTFNSVIHRFALPNVHAGMGGAADSGLKGDFEFLITDASSTSISASGRKTLNNIEMVPIGANEASTIVDKYLEAYNTFHPMNGFKFEVAGKEVNAPFATAGTKRSFRITGYTQNFAYRYTPEGLDFYKEYELEEVKFKFLKFVEPGGAYPLGYFTNDAETVKLIPGS